MTYIHQPEPPRNPPPGSTVFTICPACSTESYKQPWPCAAGVEERELAVVALREALRGIADLPALPPLPGVMPAAMVRQAVQQALTATPASNLQRLVRIGRRAVSMDLIDAFKDLLVWNGTNDDFWVDKSATVAKLQAWLEKED